MVTPSLTDLRKAYWGAGDADSVNDAEYEQLLSLYNSGTTAVSVAAQSGAGLDVGCSTMPRGDVLSNAITLASQNLRLTFFTVPRSFTATRLRLISGATAAGATPTLCRAGLWTVAANGDITLVASIANDTSLFAAANTEYLRNLTAAYEMKAGTRMAGGLLVVTAAAAPSVVGGADGLTAMAAANKRTPASATINGAMTDLPANLAYASQSGATGGLGRHYMEVLPAA